MTSSDSTEEEGCLERHWAWQRQGEVLSPGVKMPRGWGGWWVVCFQNLNEYSNIYILLIDDK